MKNIIKRNFILKYLLIPAVTLTILMVAFTFLSIEEINSHSKQTIKNDALANLNKDVAMRFWASVHGGVYVPITEQTQPNPFLTHVPERDIQTPSGKKLTLMNPAYMLRQQMNEFYKLYGIKGHLTSLNYYRPETAPDRWEIQALKSFETGVQDYEGYSEIGGKQFFRLMRPLSVNEACLKCHSGQGYKVGDIRGGVSVSIPLEKYRENERNEILSSIAVNSTIWIFGLIFVFIFTKKLFMNDEEKDRIKVELEKTNSRLEEEVEIRTSEILEANQKLKDKIQEKLQLEEKLSKTNKVINNSQAVAFVWSNKPNWPVEYVSENVVNIFGYTVDDFVSGRILYSEIIYKKDIARISEETKLNEQNISPKGFVQKNYRLVSKSGKIIWVEDRTTIIKDENGNITHYEGILVDISQRKNIEEENHFKTEFERKIASISTYFVNLQLKDINKALSFTTKTFGHFLEADRSYIVLLNSKNEFIVRAEFIKDDIISSKNNPQIFKMSLYNWLHFSLIKGKPILVENVEQMSKAAENERKLMNRFGMKSFLGIPIMVNGMLYGFIGFDSKEINGALTKNFLSLFRLLTEVITNLYSRYLSELELTAISDRNRSLISAVEQTDESVVITDINGSIEYVNPKFVELTGYSLDEVIGKNPRILKSGNTSQEEYQKMWNTILSGLAWKGQFKNISKNKSVFWEKVTISPIKNDVGVITHFLSIKEDITKKILLENQKSLSAKMESIGQLAAGIAHEINTPMQYVGDNANFLADAYISMTQVFNDFTTFLENGEEHTTEDIRDFYQTKMAEMDLEFIFEEVPGAIEQTRTGIERVTKIVKAMKDFAHPGSKEKAFFNLNNGLQNTVTISKNEWKYIAEIELDLDENIEGILCLQDELNQVFLNMIVNAAHAIAEKNQKTASSELGKIFIGTSIQDDNVIIKISDTGNGIKKENVDRIFDPFFTTKDVGKGTGQGLAIAHDIIVNKHKGQIKVESELGVGSVFLIELPINGNNGKA